MNILRDDIEYIIHCEDNGTIIGPISKKHAHIRGVRENLCHYSTWSMVFNIKTSEYGIQLKNPKKHDKLDGNKRDMGVAGHNCYIKDGEGYRFLDFGENLQKETYEEIGLNLKIYENIDKFREGFKNFEGGTIGYIFDKFLYISEYNKEFVGLGIIMTDEKDIKFNDGEVVDFKRLNSKSLKNFMKVNEDKITNSIKIVYEKVEKFLKNEKIL